METKEAMDHLRKVLKEDSEYYYGWQANIAVSFQDAVSRSGQPFENLHRISNEAARHFLDVLIGVP